MKIDVPPLRERGGDVLHLARHFLKIYGERHGQPEVELVVPELTSIPDRVGGEGEPSKRRRRRHGAE